MTDIRTTTADECTILGASSQDHMFQDIKTTQVLTIPAKPDLVTIIQSFQFKTSAAAAWTLTFASTGKDTVIWRQTGNAQVNAQGFPYFVGGKGADITITFSLSSQTVADLLVGFFYGPPQS